MCYDSLESSPKHVSLPKDSAAFGVGGMKNTHHTLVHVVMIVVDVSVVVDVVTVVVAVEFALVIDVSIVWGVVIAFGYCQCCRC